jgi:tetratricopeptide (TPR) repeat protein/transcriptional regulator with XRE-family HTH domain
MAGRGGERLTDTVADLVRRFRTAAGLSQEELAERSGLSADGISAIERGVRRQPHPQTLRSLAAALSLASDERLALLGAAARGQNSRRRATGRPPEPRGEGAGNTHVPQRVFLSHTSDLGQPQEPESFVGAAVGAVLRAQHVVIDMAYFAARDTAPADYSTEMVTQSDVYVGIIGLCYGMPVQDRPDLSYTELEFEVATERGLPRLIFLVRETSTHLQAIDQSAKHRRLQDTFRQRLMGARLTIVRISTPAELELAIYQALVDLRPTANAPAKLARAQALLASMPADTLPDRRPLPAGPHMPIGPNPLFVGRRGELLHVASALKGADATVALGQVVASTGLGGLGKTQSAVELVHRYGRFFAGGVFWLSFASAAEIPLQVAACTGSGAVGLEADVSSRPLDERVKLVMSAWQSAWPRLLVFDNCEEESLLETWRPTSGGCRVLVTSRRSHWSPTLGVTVLPLDLLPRPDSIELLRRYLPDLAADDQRLDAIADRLGDLPLALHLAGRYLLAYRAEVSLDDYLAELEQPAVIRHASLLGEGLDDSPSPTHHVQSLAQTFALCLGRLDREREVDRVAIALLARMAWLAPGEAVPRDLLGRTLEGVGPRQRADGLRRLSAVGLVEEGEGWLRLHRLLVHFVRQEGLDADVQPAVARALIGCGEDAWQGHLTGSALAAVIPHVVEVAVSMGGGTGDERRAAELCAAAGEALQYAGDLRAARPWYERALSIREQVLGHDHPDTASSLNDLALLLQAQGELEAVRPLYERAQDITERVLGHDHPDTALGLYNLGMLLRDQGELDAARPLLERALDIQEWVLGPHHPQTVFSLNGLGVVLRDQGELDSARPRLERALGIREQVLGHDHPHTAVSLYNLGILLWAQGELNDARAHLERALDIQERVLGPDHPHTAFSLNGLGVLLWDQGEPEAARARLERALAIRERVLGPDHPHTARSLNDLALLDQAHGELDAARALLERALDIRERALGRDHPDTVVTRRSLEELAG